MAAAASFFKCMLLVLLLCLLLPCGNSDHFGESAYLKVPAAKFQRAVESTAAQLRQVISTISKLSAETSGGDLRLSNALSNCHDLLDFSLDLLNSTAQLVTSRNPSRKDRSSNGNYGSFEMMKNVKCPVNVNPETCREGFDGIPDNNPIRNLIFSQLDSVATSAQKLSAMVNPNYPTTTQSKNRGGRKLIVGDHDHDAQFPDWVKPHDRKLILEGAAASITGVNAVVAADGTGDFTTIMAAIEEAPKNSTRRYVIHVKKGVYKEYVDISKHKWNIMMFGDGIDATVISGNRSKTDELSTYRSATFGVKGRGFVAMDMTFENTAGPEMHQAVAFRSDSDQSVVYRCAIRGYQDALYSHCHRQFYKECKISGTVDFIFGHGTAVFQDCQITARKALPGQKNTITAQNRDDLLEPSGFSFQFCRISAEPGAGGSTPTYLGRPWKIYSTTVVMQSYISGDIRPEGWLEWNGDLYLDTLFYGEYGNYGPGANLSGRVKWPGYHVLNESQASRFTVTRFINGDGWLPSTGVNYTSGLAY
ncbi:hypothetical protein ACP275_10G067100 [Erythranthe tilingii]